MTKKQAIARKAAWSLALAEGRVVRYPELNSFTSFPTVEAAQANAAESVVAGIAAEIVTLKP